MEFMRCDVHEQSQCGDTPIAVCQFSVDHLQVIAFVSIQKPGYQSICSCKMLRTVIKIRSRFKNYFLERFLERKTQHPPKITVTNMHEQVANTSTIANVRRGTNKIGRYDAATILQQ